MRARTAAALAVAAALIAPAAASAATLGPLKPCYVSVGPGEEEREAIDVRASGFTPLSTVDVLVSGEAVASGQADVLGEVAARVRAPYREDGEGRFPVAVVERGNPANVAAGGSKVSALTVMIRPKRARPSSRVRFRGRGFTGQGAVYGHYVFGGRERETVRLARPHGDCGTFSVRRRQIPVESPRTGSWTLQVDQQEAYSERPASAFVRLLIRVQRVFRSP